MITFANPFAAGTNLWSQWETDGTKTLTPAQEVLVNAANHAYTTENYPWFTNQTTPDLLTLWGLVSGINIFSGVGSWDDEVYDVLHARNALPG